MKIYIHILLIICCFLDTALFGQHPRYDVKRTLFSTGTNDEFSPVLYKESIIFCSNQHDNSIIGYTDENSRVYKIFKVSRDKNATWKHPVLLAKELTSDFNDGPATFDEKRGIIYYSRNNSIEKFLRNVSDTSNKLGIYCAELVNGIWTNIRPFAYSNMQYSFCTPSLTIDGERIFFSSDMPGGFGGMDLYYCDLVNGNWNPPVNLGPVINTRKSECFPFACKNGKLFFASDGHEGFGGKDLFYSQEINGEWIIPVHLDSAINSTADDFGLVTDSTSESGYFSSNRRTTDDIYSFSSPKVEFAQCDSIKENNYCFTFYDEQHQIFDTMMVRYQWDFGDGMIYSGAEVNHCFPGPGSYMVKLRIVDELTGKPAAEEVNYHVDLEKSKEVFINSNRVGIVDKSIVFEAVQNNLKGSITTDYYWNFGEGFKPGPPTFKQSFGKEGEYTVQLGMLGEKDSMGRITRTCVKKTIRIFDHFVEIDAGKEPAETLQSIKSDSHTDKISAEQMRVYCMDNLSAQQKEKIRKVIASTGKFPVGFNQYGIIASSFPFLDRIAGILKDDPGLKLEIILHDSNEGISCDDIPDIRAQQLTFYFKTREVNANAVHSEGFDSSKPSYFNFEHDRNSKKGLLEFVFME